MTPDHEQYRQRAAVLRLLLSGGLITRDTVFRHTQSLTTQCDCAEGGELNVAHVSWKCQHHTEQRRPLLPIMSFIERSQPCFKYATIVSVRDDALLPHVRQVQEVLVNIWQRHIRSYLGVQESSVTLPSRSPTTSAGPEHYILERGHWIESAPGGGVYCRRCGVFVTEIRHRRLKISYRDCPLARVPQLRRSVRLEHL